MNPKVTNWFSILNHKPGVVYNVPTHHYDEAIGAVPPIYCPPTNGFSVTAMGEAYSHEPATGKPTYYCYVMRKGQAYGVVSTLAAAAEVFTHYFNANGR